MYSARHVGVSCACTWPWRGGCPVSALAHRRLCKYMCKRLHTRGDPPCLCNHPLGGFVIFPSSPTGGGDMFNILVHRGGVPYACARLCVHCDPDLIHRGVFLVPFLVHRGILGPVSELAYRGYAQGYFKAPTHSLVWEGGGVIKKEFKQSIPACMHVCMNE